jgi:hypothetical protein
VLCTLVTPRSALVMELHCNQLRHPRGDVTSNATSPAKRRHRAKRHHSLVTAKLVTAPLVTSGSGRGVTLK